MLWVGFPGKQTLRRNLHTECLLESALGNNVLRGEGSSWAEGDVELRNTHRAFRQSTRNLRACVPPLNCLVLKQGPWHLYLHPHPPSWATPRKGMWTQWRWCFWSKGCELSAVNTSSTWGFEYLSHEVCEPHHSHYNYLYLKIRVSITRPQFIFINCIFLYFL